MDNLIKTVLGISKDLSKLKNKVNNLEGQVNNPLYGKYADNQEVMQTLKISPKSLFNLRKSKSLPYTHLNGKILYKIDDVLRILEENSSTHKNK